MAPNSRQCRTIAVLPFVAVVLALASSLTACSSNKSVAKDPNTITVYNGQHEAVTKMWADAFTAKTGIKVSIRSGEDDALANQILAEGTKSPADVFMTENSPAMAILENAGRFVAVDQATLDQVPTNYRPATGKWVAAAARSSVFIYNKTMLSAAELPKTMLELADPKWKGRWGAAASGADFQAIVSALLQLKGEQATLAWLKSMKTNAKVYPNNVALLAAVNSGQVAGGVEPHYYWFRDQASTKENSNNVVVDFVKGEDALGYLSLSGAGVLNTSTKQAKAQQFVQFITSAEGQKLLADSDDFEYSVGSGAASNKALTPLAELEPPAVNSSVLDSAKVIDLMTQAGLI